MDKTIDRWTDPDGNGYAFKDTVARAQNRATIDKMNTETADRKSELDIERKRIDNLIKELPATAGEYQQSKLVLHSYDNTAVKCTTTSGNYTNVPAFTTDQGGPLSYLYTKKSNYQIAVNKSGLYLFELRIHVNSLIANKRVELAPFVNDTRIAALASSYNTAGSFTLTQIAALPLWLSANDTVDFKIAPIDAAEVSLQLGDVLVYAIDWEDKFKIPDYTGYAAETKDIRTGADGTVYGTAGEAVRKQIGNLTEDLDDIGRSVSVFTANSGVDHSSLTDTLDISIPNGAEYYVLVETNITTGIQIAERYADGTSKMRSNNYVSNTEYLLWAKGDIVKIGVYIPTPIEKINVKLIVNKYDGIFKRLNDVSNNADRITNKILLSKRYNIEYGATYWVDRIITANESTNDMYVRFDNPVNLESQNPFGNLFATYTDGSEEHLDDVTEIGKWYKVKLNSAKTLDYMNIRFRNDENNPRAEITVTIIDGLPLSKVNEKVNKQIENTVLGSIAEARNGSLGNPSNTFSIATKKIIPTHGYKSIVIIPDIKIPDGYHLQFCVAGYYDYVGKDTEEHTTDREIGGEYLDSNISDGKGYRFIVDDDTKGFGFSVCLTSNDDPASHPNLNISSGVSLYYNLDDSVEDIYIASNAEERMAEYASDFLLCGDSVDTFVFFTDPHLLKFGTDNLRVSKSINALKYIYDKTATDYMICGGDWLQNTDTKEEACKKLSFVDGNMRTMFNDRYLPILGNHDTNYQGVDDLGNANSGELSQTVLHNILFREYEHNYYSKKTKNGRVYIFDTGLDWESSMTHYRWEQIDWYANQLLRNDDTHSFICLHICLNAEYSTETVAPTTFADNITKVANAYNMRTTITLNEKTYNFTNTNGKVAFLLCGHTHYDKYEIYNNIPIIITRNAFDWVYYSKSGAMAFDLCIVDYDNKKMRMTRIGMGDNRTINIL